MPFLFKDRENWLGAAFFLVSLARTFQATWILWGTSLLLGLALTADTLPQGNDAVSALAFGAWDEPVWQFQAVAFFVALGIHVTTTAIASLTLQQFAMVNRDGRPLSVRALRIATWINSLLPITVVAVAIWAAHKRVGPALSPLQENTSSLVLMLLGLVAAAFSILAHVLRRRIMRELRRNGGRFIVYSFWPRALAFIALLSVFLTISVWLLFAPTLASKVGALAVIISAMALLVGLWTGLVALLRMLLNPDWWNWGTSILRRRYASHIILVWLGVAFFFGAAWVPEVHEIRQTPTEPPSTLTRQAEAWLQDRCGNDCRGGEIEVWIVLAEGGGIRAAQHTNVFLDRLNELSDGTALENIYAMSGVSGGSIGLVTYLANEAAQCPAAGAAITRDVYNVDHLAPLLGGLFYTDLPTRLLAIPWAPPDRANRFERSFEHAWRIAFDEAVEEMGCGSASIENPLAAPLARLASAAVVDGNAAPVVMFSTVRVEDGEVGLVSNVSIASDAISPSTRAGVHEAGYALGTHCDLTAPPAITAAHMSARFPYINPAAVVPAEPAMCGDAKGVRHYVDGAFVDNSGSVAARTSLYALFDAADALDIPRDRLQVRIIHINSASVDIQPLGLTRQSSAPLDAAARARETRGRPQTAFLCRLVALETGRPNSARACDALNNPEQGGLVDGESAVVSAGVWYDASIPTSLDPADPRYAPLAWLLTRASRDYVEQEANAAAERVWAALLADVFSDEAGRAATQDSPFLETGSRAVSCVDSPCSARVLSSDF